MRISTRRSPHLAEERISLSRKLAELSGNEPVTVGYATEAGLLSALTQNTVVFGAGSISNAHQPDEYLLKKEIEPMSRILREIICLICEKGELQ